MNGGGGGEGCIRPLAQKKGEGMSKEKEQVQADRRGFLKLASAGAVLGGAAVVAPTLAQAEEDKARDEGRYHETAHVKRYYDLARF